MDESAIRQVLKEARARQRQDLPLTEEQRQVLRAYLNRCNAARRARNEAYRSLGMTRVRGGLGWVYWE